MYLVIEQGPDTHQRWTIGKSNITIGRNDTCDVFQGSEYEDVRRAQGDEYSLQKRKDALR